MAGLVPSETVQLVLAEADKLTPKKHNLGEKETKDNKTHVIILVTNNLRESSQIKTSFFMQHFPIYSKNRNRNMLWETRSPGSSLKWNALKPSVGVDAVRQKANHLIWLTNFISVGWLQFSSLCVANDWQRSHYHDNLMQSSWYRPTWRRNVVRRWWKFTVT